MRWLPPLLLACLLASPAPAQDGIPDEGDAARWQAIVDEALSAKAGWRLRARSGAADVTQLRLLQRVTLVETRWRAGAVVERDAGERRWLDHVGAWAQGQPRRGWTLALGRLRPGFGQGILFGRGAGMGTPSARPRRDATAFGSHSASERRALTGIALRHEGRRIDVSLVGGALRWDGRLDGAGTVTRLLDDGNHAGTAEAVRGRLGGRAIGGRITAQVFGAHLGITGQHLMFTRRLDLRRPDLDYAFHGRGQSAAAAELIAGNRRRGGFIAVARVGDRRVLLAGATGIAGAGLGVGALARWYDPGVFLPLGASAGSMDNERGATVRLRWRRAKAWLDVQHRPAARWRQPTPTMRRTAGMTWQDRVSRSLRLRAAAQRRVATLWHGGGLGEERLDRVRLQARWVRGRLRGVLQLDGTCYSLRAADDGSQRRYGEAVGSVWSWRTQRLRCDLQVSLHDTDGYAPRVYDAEREVPGSISIRPLYGHGGRFVGVLSAPVGALRVSVRWRTQVRDGLRHEATLQLDAGGGAR